MSIGGSISDVSGFDTEISFGISAPIGDGIEIGPSLSVNLVQTSTASSSGSQQIAAEFYVPSTATYLWYEFDALAEGGSSPTSGLVAHVWQVGQSNNTPS